MELKNIDWATHWLYVKNKQDKFDESFTILVFATFALSIQFLPPMGKCLGFLLVISWGCFLIAALCGGYRLMMTPQMDKIDGAKNALETFITTRKTELASADFVSAVTAGMATDPKTMAPQSIENLKKGLEEEERKLRIAQKNLDDIQRKLPCIFNAQIIFYLSGSLTALIFVSVNYLK